jgi:RimJ/RimL family protein N-acetyltransferase
MSATRPLVMRGRVAALAMMEKEDAGELARWHQNLEFTTLMGTPGEIHTREMREEAFARGGRPRSDSVEFAVIGLESSELVGFGGLFDMSRAATASMFVGIAPERWGEGIGTEATRLLCCYGFFYLNLYAIRLQVHSYNARGVRAYEKAGFKAVGKLRGYVLLDNKRYDEILMDITRDEFDAGDLVPDALRKL